MSILLILAEATEGGRYNGIFFVTGVLTALLGVISTCSLYAFGQLVEDIHAIRTGGARKAPSEMNCTTFKENRP